MLDLLIFLSWSKQDNFFTGESNIMDKELVWIKKNILKMDLFIKKKKNLAELFLSEKNKSEQNICLTK